MTRERAKMTRGGVRRYKLKMMKQTPIQAMTPKYRGEPLKAGATMKDSKRRSNPPLLIILYEILRWDSPRSSLFIVERARAVPARKMKVGAQ